MMNNNLKNLVYDRKPFNLLELCDTNWGQAQNVSNNFVLGYLEPFLFVCLVNPWYQELHTLS